MTQNKKYPWHEVTAISDLRDMIEKSAANFGSRSAFLNKRGDEYQSLSFSDFKDQVFGLGAGLLDVGFKLGHKAAIFSEGRWQWGLAYLAVASAGGINIPIDKDLRSQDIRHILDETETEAIFTSSRLLDVVLELKTTLPALRLVICLDEGRLPKGVIAVQDLVERGATLLKQGKSASANLKLTADLPASIVYTSGTMGSAKGVVLTHRNLTSNMMDMCRAVYIDEHDTFLSVLPLHHTYECTCGFLTPIYRGSTISYCDNYRYIASQMQEVRATIMLGVPLLFQTIYRKIMDGIREKGMSKFRLGRSIARVGELLLGNRARRLVFSELHKKFGGHLRMLISGGAASDPQVAQLFHDLGITFIQGYGLTECAPILAVNRPHYFRDAAAGFPLPSVEIRIADDGEICARGPNIMTGYYRKPDATAEILKDGWFHTGDLGYLDSDGFLFIHGRKKAVIVLNNGKNVYAEEVEATLNRSPFVLESLAWEGPDAGGKVEEVYATIVPDREEFDRYSKAQNKELTEELVEETLRAAIREECSTLAPYKRVRSFAIRWEEFDKTTTRKIKRYLYTEKTKQVSAEKAEN
jgi:long-chain acyl-CoA synthetase